MLKKSLASSDDPAVGGPKCRELGGKPARVDVEQASGGSKRDFTLFSSRMDSKASEASEESMT